jgi:hypothetical protein
MNPFLNAKKWSKQNKNDLGLPRPIFNVPEDHRKKPKKTKVVSEKTLYLHKVVPIPWQSEPEFSENKQLNLIFENEEKTYKDGRCPYCGILFNLNDNVIRWTVYIGTPTKEGPNILSDNYPFHFECMRQARKFCPRMRETKDYEFETGSFEVLKMHADDYINQFIK